MRNFLMRMFGWWEGASIGTNLWTKRNGTEVGRDAAGNVYYRNADDSRRWVIYTGDNDASRVEAEWYGWLHHTFPKPPTEDPYPHKPWEKPHRHNMTGGEGAFLRPGSIRRADVEPRSDYEAWTPK
jgi:NADH:ubiquinone oxidoreductase subunit